MCFMLGLLVGVFLWPPCAHAEPAAMLILQRIYYFGPRGVEDCEVAALAFAVVVGFVGGTGGVIRVAYGITKRSAPTGSANTSMALEPSRGLVVPTLGARYTDWRCLNLENEPSGDRHAFR